MLTEKQSRFLGFVESYCEKNGFSPSFADIAAHFGFRSLKAVSDYVDLLKRNGYLAVLPGRKQRNLVSRRVSPAGAGMARTIPLVGAIAAGRPIEAIENVEEHLTLDTLGLLNADNSMFAVRVKGDSMINRGIMDGDVVIVKKQKVVAKKDVAAVRVGSGVTLKYVRQEDRCVKLIPDNAAMQPITVKQEDDIEILGKVVKLIRKEV